MGNQRDFFNLSRSGLIKWRNHFGLPATNKQPAAAFFSNTGPPLTHEIICDRPQIEGRTLREQSRHGESRGHAGI